MTTDAGILAPILDDVEPMTPQQLKDWREERGITQAELAVHLESSLGRIRKYEQGDRQIPPFMWRALRDLDAELKTKAAAEEEERKPKRRRRPPEGPQ